MYIFTGMFVLIKQLVKCQIINKNVEKTPIYRYYGGMNINKITTTLFVGQSIIKNGWLWFISTLFLLMDSVYALSPKDGDVFIPVPVTPVSENIIMLAGETVLPVIGTIMVIVIILLIYIGWRFDFSRHPIASPNNRNVFMQTVWISTAIVLFVTISVSYLGVISSKNNNDTQMTVVITAVDDGWLYDYQGEHVSIRSSGILERYLKPGQRRLMTTNTPLILPEKTNIKLLFTSSVGIKKWNVPELGIHSVAVQGHMKQAWLYTEEPGIYYGLCGIGCGLQYLTTPIEVRIIPRREFFSWLDVTRQSTLKDATDK